jgi:uncharacterized protein (TIGR02147 family)
MPPGPPDIFAYADYRAYLSDWLAFKKRTPGFSLRGFAKRAGFSAHNELQLVVRGERRIALTSAPKYAKALGLNRREAAYFQDLVIAEATRDAKKLAALRRDARSRAMLEKRELALFKQWLAPVICEMVRLFGFRDDPVWIAGLLGNRIAPRDVAAILTGLEAGGFLTRRGGKLTPSDQTLDTGDGMSTWDIFAYHETALAKAGDALHEVPPDRRNFQVLTLALSAPAIGVLNKLIADFEADVLELANQPGPKASVLQVSLQAFTITSPRV